MGLKLADDYIQLKKIDVPTSGGILLPHATSVVSHAEVLAVGPGEQRPTGGRNEMPCAVGDTVLVHTGAGLKYSERGEDFWFVFASRKDIIGVVEG